ncbi:MAG: hypothetical protein QMC83_02290 [Thermodesulfovibrionales bacterium]|nr:hypothetical protein [Thermodesulfovibrionales bacterium]
MKSDKPREVYDGVGRAFQKGWQRGEGKSMYHPGYRLPFPLRLLNRLFGHFQRKLLDELEIPERGKDLRDTISISPEEIGRKIEYPARKRWGRSKDLLIRIPQGIKNGM